MAQRGKLSHSLPLVDFPREVLSVYLVYACTVDRWISLDEKKGKTVWHVQAAMGA